MPDAVEMQREIDEMMALTPPELTSAIDAMIADLRARRAVPGPAIGSVAPPFALPDVRGTTVALAERLADGPVVLTFYRGAWCPICNIELRALQARLDDIAARGASLVAISPQAPDASLPLAESLELGFDVLGDLDQSVAEAYGLRFRLSDEMIELYRTWGIPLTEQNADGSWDLPVPATFVLDRDGVVRAAHVDPDYRIRLDPEQVVEALDALGS